MKKSVWNEIKLIVFCALIGAAAGIVFWIFLFLVRKGTWALWELLPEQVLPVIWYPLLICTAGGLLIGLFRKRFGDYPEDMMTVFGRLKKNKTYPYRNMLVIVIAAVLPLIFGSSVGPEAGMVGIMVALCCWAGDNLKFAGSQSQYYSRVGAAVSLSVMFRSPLFGILNAEETIEGEVDAADSGSGRRPVSKAEKIIIYCIAVGAGFGSFFLMNRLTGEKTSGFPSFDAFMPETPDYFLFILYLVCGILLGLFFEFSEKLFEKLRERLPAVIRETAAGLVLGVFACFLPVICFSGEEQMAVLMDRFAVYAPLAMIGIALLKVVMTNLCIQFGLKGGHFFPLIFAAVCLGYGISLMFFPGESSHAVFAAAVVTAATLGVTLKKPLAASMLLLLCFPVRSLLWIVPSAAIAALAGRAVGKRSGRNGSRG